jgi:hypothetical protein
MSDTPYPHIIYFEDADTHVVFVPETVQPPDPPDPPDPPSEGSGTACLDIDGLRFVFDPEDGTELDPYVDPAGDFIMDNILCTHPDLPHTIAFYRPDRTGGREEWVFEHGQPRATAEDDNLPAYTATITRRDGTTATVEAPSGHYWFARWRWQSAPRPVRRNYEQLAKQNLIPHFDTTGLATGAILSVSPYKPMATCGMPSNQGQTGGYPGLGIITGWMAQYLVRNAPETAWRDQAEAINSYPCIVRDPDTLAPCPGDIVDDFPGANMYSSSEGTPYIAKGPSPTRTDQGHLPSVTYVPFLLTGDPYYLESQQFVTNYQQLSLPSDSRFMVMGRYLAWPTRAIAECVAATPDVVPSWLLPRSYWLHWLDTARGYIEARAANNSDPFCYVFHSIVESGQTSELDPSKSGDHVWQQGMLDLVCAWIASWRPEWIEPAEWAIRSCIDRTSATSGWCRARCSPYHMRLQNASVLASAMTKTSCDLTIKYVQQFVPGMSVTIDSETMVLGDSSDGLTWEIADRPKPADHAVNKAVYGTKCLSWKEAADLNILTYGWADDVADNDHLAPSAADLTYQGYVRAALAEAIHAGLEVPGLRESYDWLDAEMRRLVIEKKFTVGDNWTVVPGSTSRRRHRRRSERTDPQHHPKLQALIDAIRGED